MKLIATLLSCMLGAQVFLATACSQPVLESANCLAARDVVKKLYSLHMDGGASPKSKLLDRIRPFLSVGLQKELQTQTESRKDYLTQSSDFPRAFRAGECRDSDDGVEFDVLLFWSQGSGKSERRIVVSAKDEDSWVIDKVSAPD